MKKHWGCIAKHKRTKRFALLVTIIGAVFITMSSIPALSEPAPEKEVSTSGKGLSTHDYDLQEVSYDVYAGGIHAVRADMVMDFRKKERYSMKFFAETRGLLGTFVPWSGAFETHGWALPGMDRVRLPEEHISTAQWRGEEEIKTYRYDKEKGFIDLTTLYVGKKTRTENPDEKLTKDTTDIISATLMIMEHVSDGKDCKGTDEVFDGKRRFKLIFHHKGYVMFKKTRYNTYEGPAVECVVEVEPVTGAWYKKPRGWLSIQEQGRSLGTMPTVWMAQVIENAVVVPVRVRVKTTYGTLFMHMTKYKSGDTLLSVKD